MNETTAELLQRTQKLVEPDLRKALDRLNTQLAPPALYHFGWVDEKGQDTTSGGKGVRAALALLSAEAVGADATVAVPGAVAVELIHNFSLLHDDIIDGDTERRHRPTVWKLFGKGDAIIVGDALHTLAFEVLLNSEEATTGAAPTTTTTGLAKSQAAGRLANATAAMIAGQSCDMSFNLRDDVSLEECVAMEADKTGALLGYAASVGAVLSGSVLSGAGLSTIAALEHYGLHLGLAFQAADDILGIWGDPKITGKPVGNDLRERKKSLPIVAALSSNTKESVQLAELLAKTAQTSDTQMPVALAADEIAHAAQLVEAAGGRQAAEEFARESSQKALAALDSVELEAGAAHGFASMLDFVVNRQH